MTSIDNWLHSFFQRIKASVAVETEALACFRIFFGLCMLLFYLPSWAWLGKVPPGFFNPRPLSFAYLTEGHLQYGAYLFFDILVIVLFLIIILGIYTRLAFGLLFVLSSILYSFSYTFDKIDHSTTILLFSYLCLTFTNIGTKIALRKDRRFSENTQQRALAVLALIICFGMVTAGFPKFINWVDFDLTTSGFLNWFLPGFFNVENNKLLTPLIFEVPTIVFEIMDYISAILEIVGIYFLWKGKKHWVFYLVIVALMHLMNILVLNIDFTQNVICYSIFMMSPALYFLYQKNIIFFRKYRELGISLVIGIAITRILMVLTGFHFSFLKSFMYISVVSIILSITAIIGAVWFLKRSDFVYKTDTIS